MVTLDDCSVLVVIPVWSRDEVSVVSTYSAVILDPLNLETHRAEHLEADHIEKALRRQSSLEPSSLSIMTAALRVTVRPSWILTPASG